MDQLQRKLIIYIYGWPDDSLQAKNRMHRGTQAYIIRPMATKYSILIKKYPSMAVSLYIFYGGPPRFGNLPEDGQILLIIRRFAQVLEVVQLGVRKVCG